MTFAYSISELRLPEPPKTKTGQIIEPSTFKSTQNGKVELVVPQTTFFHVKQFLSSKTILFPINTTVCYFDESQTPGKYCHATIRGTSKAKEDDEEEIYIVEIQNVPESEETTVSNGRITSSNFHKGVLNSLNQTSLELRASTLRLERWRPVRIT